MVQIGRWASQSLVMKCFVLGHTLGLQLMVSSAFPGQSFPPGSGGGSVHSRDLLRCPPPQETLHCVQSDHTLQSPSICKPSHDHLLTIF